MLQQCELTSESELLFIICIRSPSLAVPQGFAALYLANNKAKLQPKSVKQQNQALTCANLSLLNVKCLMFLFSGLRQR